MCRVSQPMRSLTRRRTGTGWRTRIRRPRRRRSRRSRRSRCSRCSRCSRHTWRARARSSRRARGFSRRAWRARGCSWRAGAWSSRRSRSARHTGGAGSARSAGCARRGASRGRLRPRTVGCNETGGERGDRERSAHEISSMHVSEAPPAPESDARDSFLVARILRCRPLQTLAVGVSEWASGRAGGPGVASLLVKDQGPQLDAFAWKCAGGSGWINERRMRREACTTILR